jgi:methionyl-tRNA synthetase
MPTSSTSRHLLIFVAWPYSNNISFGQIAGSILPADIFARYQRMSGHQVLMVSGSQLHPHLPTQNAEHREHQIRLLSARLGISFDLYAGAGGESHRQYTQDIFQRLYQQRLIFKDSIDSPYCAHDQRFLPDRWVTGTCPYCGEQDAGGDQCTGCGRALDPTQLLESSCRLCGSKSVEIRETEHFFLDLPLLAGPLRQWLQMGKEHWRPSALNLSLGCLTDGLVPRVISVVSGDVDGGTPIPLSGYEDKRLSAWFDGVVGYFSSTAEWTKRQGDSAALDAWWQEEPLATRPSLHYYFVGRDDAIFHTIFWPAILLGLGKLVLPYDVPTGEPMSMSAGLKSPDAGSASRMEDVDDVLERYGRDSLRFYLTSVLPERQSTTYSLRDLVARNNDDLVSTYGNVVHRVLTFLQRNFNGAIPAPGDFCDQDRAMLENLESAFATVGRAIGEVRLREGLGAAMAVAGSANRYLDERAPWKRLNSDPAAAATTMYIMLQVLNSLKILFAPYLPFSSQQLHQLLGYTSQVCDCCWEAAAIPAGLVLPSPHPLFAKHDPL